MNIKPVILATTTALSPVLTHADEQPRTTTATITVIPHGACPALTVADCTATGSSGNILWQKKNGNLTLRYRDTTEKAIAKGSETVSGAVSYQGTWQDLTGSISGHGTLTAETSSGYELKSRELSLARTKTYELTPELKADMNFGAYLGYATAYASLSAQSTLHITKASLSVPYNDRTISYDISNQHASANYTEIAEGQTPYLGLTKGATLRYTPSENLGLYAAIQSRLGLDRIDNTLTIGAKYDHAASGVTVTGELHHTKTHRNTLFESALKKAKKISSSVNEDLTALSGAADFSGAIPYSSPDDILKALGIEHKKTKQAMSLGLSKQWGISNGNQLITFATYSKPLGKNTDPATTTLGLSLEY